LEVFEGLSMVLRHRGLKTAEGSNYEKEARAVAVLCLSGEEDGATVVSKLGLGLGSIGQLDGAFGGSGRLNVE
jgi:hypothetical protein